MYTVITSPDTPVANFWGYMTETYASPDGTLYRRPLLYNELTGWRAERKNHSGEDWNIYLAQETDKSGETQCDIPYQPTVDELVELVDPATLFVNTGWPMVGYTSDNGNSLATWASDRSTSASKNINLSGCGTARSAELTILTITVRICGSFAGLTRT